MLLWKPEQQSDQDNLTWCYLRAIEWKAWPAFISQPIIPLLFIFIPWYYVLVPLLLIGWLWPFVRHRFVSSELAEAGALFVKLKWLIVPVAVFYLAYTGQYVLAVVSLLWTFIASIIGYVPGGLTGKIQNDFMKAFGYENYGDREIKLETIERTQQQLREDFEAATGIDLKTIVPTIGTEIPWIDVHLQVFQALEFDRCDTKIGPNDEVMPTGMLSPYGYLLVQSPILNQPVKLPIIHRDDFWLAASVFDEPSLADSIETDELLVTYAPRKILSDGRSGEASHVLHYVMTIQGTMEEYYSKDNNIHMAKPNPALIFGQFVYDGEIRVKMNFEPEL